MSEWHPFFAVVGSAAGALTGLMFVAMALMQGQRMSPAADRLRRSFATPTIVHFTVVVTLAGILSMPRLSRAAVGMILSFGGGVLVLYALWVIVNARRFRDTYQPDLEDRVWHFGLPVAAYLSVFLGGLSFWSSKDRAMFAVAGGTVALLVIGIHNAWDSAVWHVVRSWESQDR